MDFQSTDIVKFNKYYFLNSKVKSLGAGDSDDDGDSAMSWVNKSRKLEREKLLAEKRVRLYILVRDQLSTSEVI